MHIVIRNNVPMACSTCGWFRFHFMEKPNGNFERVINKDNKYIGMLYKIDIGFIVDAEEGYKVGAEEYDNLAVFLYEANLAVDVLEGIVFNINNGMTYPDVCWFIP